MLELKPCTGIILSEPTEQYSPVELFNVFLSLKCSSFECFSCPLVRLLFDLFPQNSSLARAFKLFRALGLRHIVVVNETNDVSMM